MRAINAAKLGDEIKLSDYLNNNQEHVRVTGLRAGQTLIIDVDLDGGYQFPDDPPDSEAKWIGAAGRVGVHTALLTVAHGSGFRLEFGTGIELRNSRGRGLVLSNCHDFKSVDPWVRGARTAGISHHNCSNFRVTRPVTIDTGNYQDAKGEGPNWPGSIKFEGCSDYKVFNAISIDHLGNGITATECSDGEWFDTVAVDVRGATHYLNAAPGHTVRRAVHVGNTNAYVVNSEEENEGASEGVRFEACYALDANQGVGFWGNEKKVDVVIARAAVVDCLLVSSEGIKLAQNANVQELDRSGTLWLPLADANPAWLAQCRAAALALKGLVLEHAEWAEIDAARLELRRVMDWGRGGQGDKPPTERPIDRAALRAWLAEAEDLVPQLQEFFERGKGLVG